MVPIAGLSGSAVGIFLLRWQTLLQVWGRASFYPCGNEEAFEMFNLLETEMGKTL
jgi:hypothetical protein